MGMIKMKPWCRRKKAKGSDTPCFCKTHKIPKIEEPKMFNTKFELELDILNQMNDQLLSEILIRLPSKCGCRCKAVSKRWCRIISTRYFITQSINCHPLPNSFTLVFQYLIRTRKPAGCVEPYFISKDVFPVQALSTHPLLSESYTNQYVNLKKLNGKRTTKRDIIIWASCDNLLLCSGSDGFYVINLLTNQWTVIPQALGSDGVPTADQDAYSELYPKMGILGRKDGDGCYKFKVIIIPTASSSRHVPSPVGFSIQVFCSELRHWSRFIVNWYPLKTAFSACSDIIAHNGRLHWMWLGGRMLVSLDVFNGDPPMMLSHSIPLPNDLVCLSPRSILGACQGQLRAASLPFTEEDIGTYKNRALNVWELEDYEKGVWKLAHRVGLWNTPVGGYIHNIQPMALHPYDKDLIFVYVGRCILLFSMRTGLFEKYCCLEREDWSKNSSLTAVQLLLHPLFPTVLPSTPSAIAAGLPLPVSP